MSATGREMVFNKSVLEISPSIMIQTYSALQCLSYVSTGVSPTTKLALMISKVDEAATQIHKNCCPPATHSVASQTELEGNIEALYNEFAQMKR